MSVLLDRFDTAALEYSSRHGRRVWYQIEDEISMAIGQKKWTVVHFLQEVRRRLLRLQL